MTVNENKHRFDSIPCIELSNFAVNADYISNHPKAKGIGKYIFAKYVLSIAEAAQALIGVKILCIFALPYNSLISRYESMGFKRLPAKEEKQLHSRIKPNYDAKCIFMYQEL